jgi:hypothetical protein
MGRALFFLEMERARAVGERVKQFPIAEASKDQMEF